MIAEDDVGNDFETDIILSRAELVRRRSARIRRQNRHITRHLDPGSVDGSRRRPSPNRLETTDSSPGERTSTSSPAFTDSSSSDSSRCNRIQYSSSPSTDYKEKVVPKVIEEVKRMPISSNKTGVLAQQIHDEFLTCKICLEAFTNPKSLDCLHTFCEECIENHANSESSYKKYSDYREFTCPLCRKRTSLPPGGVKKLPDNFLVSSLTEVIDRQRPSKYTFCDICKLVSRKHKEATAKCLDCNKLLCKACVEQHQQTKVTKNHNIFDVEIEKDIECKEHNDEVVRFYCETCETPVCVLCTFNDHKDHEITQFSDAVKQYKTNIENLLMDCKNKLDSFEKQIEALSNCEQCVRTAEQKIRDVSIDMIGDIRNREKFLLEEIRTLYGKETMALIDRRENLQSDLDGLRSTVQLTELILKGKDMELLLLKKEVQQKLESLSKSVMKELPKTAAKVITFVPGTVDMGYIHDQDRPLLSTMRRAIGNTSFETDIFNKEDFIRTIETQTESSSLNCTQQASATDEKLMSDAAVQTDDLLNGCQMTTNGYDMPEERHHPCRREPVEEEETISRRRRRRRDRGRMSRTESSDEISHHESQGDGTHRSRRYRSYEDDD